MNCYYKLGYVNYRLNKYSDAKEIFSQIASVNSPRSQQALFFSALIELELDNEDQAIQRLNELESSPSPSIRQSAKELNTKLKSPLRSLTF
jgi:TolA-binding protein